MVDILGIYMVWGMGVAVLACLVSESKLWHPVREYLKFDILYCPICLGFWLAAPALWRGMTAYLATVAFSNLWMLVILKVYKELDETSDAD